MTLIQDTMAPASAARADEREHLWRHALNDRLANFDVRPTGQPQRPPSVACRDLGDLLVTDWECPSLEGVRTREMANRDPDDIALMTVFNGSQILETPRDTFVLRPGDVLIMSTRVTGKVVVPKALKKRSVRIPVTALLPFDPGPRVPDCLLLPGRRSPLARLAHDYLGGMGPQIEAMSPLEAEGARKALLALAAGMIQATRTPDVGQGDFLPLLRRQMEAWIVDHLTMGAIRVHDLAAAHNVASRTVHRAFSTTGETVGSVVRAHRIAAARTDLVTTRQSIASIAHRWGFYDQSHLAREFRRAMSMSPGDYREAYSIV